MSCGDRVELRLLQKDVRRQQHTKRRQAAGICVVKAMAGEKELDCERERRQSRGASKQCP